MAYISTEEVADIRARLKEAFPLSNGWKFSVRKSSGSLGIDVGILRAPVDFVAWDFDEYSHDPDMPKSRQHAEAMERTKVQTTGMVNHHWFREHYTPETVKVLEKIVGIVMRDHWDESDIQTDYFHCAFYPHFEIGKDWQTPIEKSEPQAA